MEKKEQKRMATYFYNDQGTNEVSEQIMNAYNSGVIDQPDGQYDMSLHLHDVEDLD